MKNKICKKCYNTKPLREFRMRTDTNKFRNECKKCLSLYFKKYVKRNNEKIKLTNNLYKKKKRWKIILIDIKKRCEDFKNTNYKHYGGRGIKCQITESELKTLWFRDKAYLLKRPSIDRIDNDGHYEYSNCRFIELGANVAERNKRVSSKKVAQYNLNGKLLKTYSSMTEAYKTYGYHISNISSCCKGKYKQSYGYIWKFI